MFGRFVVLVLEGSGLRLLDTEDLVVRDDDATAVFEFDHNLAGEDFQSQYPALTMMGYHSRADGRQFALESLVGIKLISQTAFEPTTTPRNFRGVERRFLNFRHP